MQTNLLYGGDNLSLLRTYFPDESVDLIYLDPPFNSNRDYSVIFKDESGRKADAQIVAFKDTWHWGPQPQATYAYLTTTARHLGHVPPAVSALIAALRSAIGANQMMAYIVEMTVRLVELHRVLKPTGSLYLHCDPTASHYLKVVLDAIFGPVVFKNEIIWKRTTAHSDSKQGATHFGRVHDVILFCTKGNEPTFNPQWTPYDQSYIESHYRYVEPETGRRYRKGDLTAHKPGGDTSYEWRGVRPYKGRYWAYSRAKMEEFERQGRLVYTRTGMPEFKRYLDEMPGRPPQDVWDDISAINSQASERLGYPTQKPLALLKRIINASSNPGDVVLDPFCGCGTAIVAAATGDEDERRRWIGIDITEHAIGVMLDRLKDDLGLTNVPVIRDPKDVEGARQLALSKPDGRFRFQRWALGLVGIQQRTIRMGADRGIDGILTFPGRHGALETVVVSVKSGRTSVKDIRDLLERRSSN